MRLLNALETATYPLWINDSEDEINTDRYEEYTTCAFEQFPNLGCFPTVLETGQRIGYLRPLVHILAYVYLYYLNSFQPACTIFFFLLFLHFLL